MTSKIVITLMTGLRPDPVVRATTLVYHNMAFGMARCNGSDESALRIVVLVAEHSALAG
jgi:hypothetical protein